MILSQDSCLTIGKHRHLYYHSQHKKNNSYKVAMKITLWFGTHHRWRTALKGSNIRMVENHQSCLKSAAVTLIMCTENCNFFRVSSLTIQSMTVTNSAGNTKLSSFSWSLGRLTHNWFRRVLPSNRLEMVAYLLWYHATSVSFSCYPSPLLFAEMNIIETNKSLIHEFPYLVSSGP